jgi:hypothetical protein
MATRDGFDPDDSLPLFLSADEPELGIGSDRAGISLRFVLASILVAAAIAVGVSILSIDNPMTLFADATASVDKSASQPGTNEPTPSIQSAVVQLTADAEAPPVTPEGPTHEMSVSEPASQIQAENSETSLGALFREFQAWNAEQDARDLAKPARDDPAPVAEIAPAEIAPAYVRPMQKHRRARTIRNARAEMIRHVRERRANIRQKNERVQARPAQDAQAQTQSAQYAEPPSFLESLNPFRATPPQR